ncbi:hypothetical protein GGTG_13057 [Gaeumannomyces tritici R3-111a-1]|uniref:Uncharacterized protein n=1 Tax=Gaeumannomyces tritici (strain R3-111a-1) TaxID=644352 RepID=J3PHS6_GAET3|nr:hypothetical protein GGTG_13057 [Gaeumannomyces tritici R3-111a-1]EJT69438.1 hypothetical protein GGTG_13057 [Gaeumannomyces tritici R3-111a-1]
MQFKIFAPLAVLLGSGMAQAPEATCSRSLPAPDPYTWRIGGIRNWLSQNPEGALRGNLGTCGSVGNWRWTRDRDAAQAEFTLNSNVDCVARYSLPHPCHCRRVLGKRLPYAAPVPVQIVRAKAWNSVPALGDSLLCDTLCVDVDGGNLG